MHLLSKKNINQKSIIFLISIILFFLILIIVIYQKKDSEEVVFKTEGQKEYTFGKNLLINPGFEETGKWKIYGEGYEIDTETKHSGNQSIKTTPNNVADKVYGAFQGMDFDFEGEEKRIVIGGWSKNEGEVADGGKLIADVYSKDGSETQYGLEVSFDSSQRHVWQYNEEIFTIKKPSYIVLYVITGGQIGAPVYFDDIFVAEVIKKVDEGFFVFDDTVVSIPIKQESKKSRKVYSLGTQDGLVLSLSENSKVQELSINDKNLVYKESVPISGFFVRDVAQNSDFIAIKGSVLQKDNIIQQKYKLKSLKLEFDNIYTSTEDYIEIRGKVKNFAKDDRAITIYYALPINALGWKWGEDIRNSTMIDGNREYFNTKHIDTAGKTSVYPISVISKDVNLSYAVRLDEPRIVRMEYNSTHKIYYIAFDLGLSPETKKFPNQADFSFIIYKSDPQWGFRSAIERYYNFYPEFFEKRVNREGIWLAGTGVLKKTKNPEDFGFMFHHGLRDVDMGDKLGIYSCDYSTMRVKVHCLFDAETKPSLDEIINSLKNKDDASDLELISNSALHNKNGEFYNRIVKVGWFVDKVKGRADERGYSWCGVFYLNPDPEISEGFGQWTYNLASTRAEDYRKKGMMTDGISFDGISTQYLNFRKEHFNYVDFPLSFDYVTKKPVIVDAFSNYEFLKYAAEKQHSLGKIIMANGFPADYMFVSHLIDSANVEVGKPLLDAKANLARTLLYQKPYSYMLKGDFSLPEVLSKIEPYMKKALFYGNFLTAFNVSGGGEDTNYFEHPEWYENDRHIFKKYVPLVKKISQAGWEPITYARSSDAEVYVERYGEFYENNLYFTLLNNSKTPKTVTLTIETEILGINDEIITLKDMLQEEKILAEYHKEEELLNIEISIIGQDVRLLKIERR